jgi:hypothetical protein
MKPLTKRILIVMGVLLFAVLAYVAYGYHNLKVQSAAAQHVRAERHPMFQAQLLQYQRALPVGTARAEVIRYLQLRDVPYAEAREMHVCFGDEPDIFPCDRWGVYVSFEFGHPQIEVGSPQMNDEVRSGSPGHDFSKANWALFVIFRLKRYSS